MPNKLKGLRVGIEAKIKYNPILDVLGNHYESIRRSGLNDMQKGMSETEIEKTYQHKYNIQWAWADSIATEVKQTYNQLKTAKQLNITRIKEQIKKKTKKAKSILKQLFKIKNPEQKHRHKALGLKSKIIKIIYSKQVEIPFIVTEDRRQRKSSLLYALEKQKPITVQVFRREHKKDQWYIHLTTYIQEIPITTTIKNGCIGVDFNRNSVEWVYVLPDGNIKDKGKITFKWQGFSSGQRKVMIRNLVVKLSELAFNYQCPIAIESLDFSKKKASMSEASKAYKSMLSNLSTGMFREAIESRCRRYGIELIKVNPAFTSVIGMIKFMSRYGLNSGTAAAMTIARRAIGYSERAPKCLVRPEDRARHSWTTWNRIARFLKSNKIRRSQLFDWTKTLEKVLIDSDINETTSRLSDASSQSNRKTGKSPSPEPKYVQLCLGF